MFVQDIANLLTLCFPQEYQRQESPKSTLLQARGGGGSAGVGRGRCRARGGRGEALGRGAEVKGGEGLETDYQPKRGQESLGFQDRDRTSPERTNL